MSKPVVIPKEHLEPGREYEGYVARPEGLVRKDAEVFTGWGKDNTLRFKPIARPVPNEWGVDAVKRRTPQERVISLASRILKQYQQFGLTEECFKAVQEVCWEVGIPATFEDAAALARRYLEKAEIERREAEQHQIVRQSPYVLDSGRGNQPAQSLSPGEE